MAIEFKGTPSLMEVDKRFQQYFNVKFSLFWDRMMSMLTMEVKIDVLKFDDYLHREFGDYEKDGKSMNMIIEEKYGKEALEFIHEL